MKIAMNEKITDAGYDNLIYDVFPKAEVMTVTFRKETSAAATYKRGCVLALSTGTGADGKYVALGTTEAGSETLTANAILCDDVTVGTDADVTVLAYRTGHFNEKALSFAGEYTFTAADKEALRDAGILISESVEY